ncbi:MAG: DNA topoisomerase, partial [Candidatus Gracilibacteria bacterium]|nr:DNA topoisomerase [Candidatus Gracilibacteria bacterium]
AKYSTREVHVNIKEKYNFVSEGKTVLEIGFKELDSKAKDKKDENNIGNNIKKGETIKIKEIILLSEKTTPPPKLTYESLLSYMSSPRSFYSAEGIDDEDKEGFNILNKAEGIGTGATRDGIIENIVNQEYISEDKKGFLTVEESGSIILKTVDKKVKDVLFTSEWEKRLSLISLDKTEVEKEKFIKYLNDYISDIVTKTVTDDLLKAEEIGQKAKKGILIDQKSPEGWDLFKREKKDVPGKFYVTSDNNKDKKTNYPLYYSDYTSSGEISKEKSICETENKCPKCGGGIKIFSKKDEPNIYFAICRKNNLLKECNFYSTYDINKDLFTTITTDLKCPKCDNELKILHSKKNGKNYAVCSKNNDKVKGKEKCDFIKEFDKEKNKLINDIELKCPKCSNELKVLHSKKNGKDYAVCSKNDKTKKGCDFMQEFDRGKKKFIIGEKTGIKFEGNEIYENKNIFKT